MNKNEHILSLIQKQGVLPLFYHDDMDVCCGVIDALYNAGIRIIEFTNRGANAVRNFTQIKSLINKRWQGLEPGVGTILNAEEAKTFIKAGASFIVCPGVIPAVAQTVHDAGLLCIPGCLTATEIIIAKENGAGLVKIFPGSLVGPSYITALKEVFADMMFMPTGGVEVNQENINAWFRAGVAAVGLGSKVISKELMQKRDYKMIGDLAKKAFQMVKSVKENN